MFKTHGLGLLVILFILMIALFGGVKSANFNFPSGGGSWGTGNQVDNLETPVDTKNRSVYSGVVSFSYMNRSSNPSQEYVSIRVSSNAKTSVPITGWKIASLSSGASVTIPQGARLVFIESINQEGNIVLEPGEIAYISTGASPNGMSFKLNKCSGYLTQFGVYTPNLRASCPQARSEDLSRIPKVVANDACFDYIDSYPTCKIQTEPLPISWTSECKNFITNLGYSSCINTHKNDKDFYQEEWRVFLKRNQSLWKNSREHIVLYDLEGKIVDSLSY